VDDEFDKPHENPTKELMEGFDNDDVQANVQMDHGARPSGLRRRLSAPMDDDVDVSQHAVGSLRMAKKQNRVQVLFQRMISSETKML